MKKIEIPNLRIDNIFQISDVHWRLFNRHEEYREGFEKIYKRIEAEKENSIIVLTGDLTHNKISLGPELILELREMFVRFASIAPTLVILGNHDLLINNKSRLDSLTPIIKSIENLPLYYLRDTDVYDINGISFSVMAVDDEPKNYITADKIDSDYKIALFHGTVDGALSDNGFKLTNDKINLNLFKGFDLTLLGDLHLPAQFLDKEKTVGYPGSTFSQNFSEEGKHGYLKWNLKNRKAEFIEVPNDYSHVTIDIEDGKIVNEHIDIPKKPRVRLRVKNTINADIQQIVTELRKQYQITELVIQKEKNVFDTVLNKENKIGNTRDTEYQNSLIEEYLKEHFPLVTSEEIDKVRDLNRNLNTLLPKIAESRNVIYKLKKFKWSNTFSYGPDNEIDFEKLEGIYGLFAKSHTGKSSAFSSLCYCIWDKCSVTDSAGDVMNTRANEFDTELNFELNGLDYFIKRTGKRKKEEVPVKVDFYYIDTEGNKQSLNGEKRSDTNKVIRGILGTYDDFIITSFSTQVKNSSFVETTRSQRIDLLSRFLDTDIFGQLNKLASKESNDISVLLKEYKKIDYSLQLSEAEEELDRLQKEEMRIKERKKKKDEDITIIRNDIDKLKEKIEKIKDITFKIKGKEINIVSITDINNFNLIKEKLVEDNKLVTAQIDNEQKVLTDLENKRDKVKEKIDATDKEKLLKKFALYEATEKLIGEKQKELQKAITEVTSRKEKVHNLKNHKYNPDCEYCNQNIFVIDAKKAEDELPHYEENHTQIKNSINTYTEKLLQFNGIKSEKDNYENLEKLQLQIQSQLDKKENEISKLEKEISDNNNDKENCEKLILSYNENLSIIEKNRTLEDKIKTKKEELETELDSLKGITDKLIEVNGNIKIQEKIIDDNTKSIKKLEELELSYKLYEYYLKATHREGVPFKLITNSLQIIEPEVNNILQQIDEFTVKISADEKNINADMMYGDRPQYPIELSSGMERFIISLAFRVALSTVSSLPKPDIFIIDEGFSALDNELLSCLPALFEYLKSQYKTVILISHLDIKDYVDQYVSVEQDSEGYSNLILN